MKPNASRQRGAHAPRVPLSAPPPKARTGCAAPSVSSGAGTGDAGGALASRYTRGRVCSPKVLVAVALLCAWPAWAQLSWTNSATLSVALAGSNVLLRAEFATTNGAFNLLEADRLDRLQLPRYAHQISNQIYDLNWVPASREMRWTLTNAPAASPRYFRLLLEPVLSRGRVWVFPNGPIDYTKPVDWDHPTYVKPTEVWIDNLGEYDLEGNLIGANDGYLTGFYVETRVNSTLPLILEDVPDLTRNRQHNNDFRVAYSDTMTREELGWLSEAQSYWQINDYRNRLMNDAFIEELDLPPALEENLRVRQYRPDLYDGTPNPGLDRRPWVGSIEFGTFGDTALSLRPEFNYMTETFRSPHDLFYPEDTRLSFPFDPDPHVADFAGLMAFWILGSNQGLPPESVWAGSSTWAQNIVAALNDGLSAWVKYRYSGEPEQSKYFYFVIRRWQGQTCDGQWHSKYTPPTGWQPAPKDWIPCLKGTNVRNAMMFNEADWSKNGVLPFYSLPRDLTKYDGPVSSDLAAQYFGAIFYDIANEAGLGVHKADLLFWKTLSLIVNIENFTMRDFGSKILDATEALQGKWKDLDYTRYVADVFRSRGIPLNGEAVFTDGLPAMVGGNFGSAHPEPHPSVKNYGEYVITIGSYTPPIAGPNDYMAYQFYKHSKYGPCDRLILTDGTFDTKGTDPSWPYNGDGTFYTEFTFDALGGNDRELGNLVLLVPAKEVRWLRSLRRCEHEGKGFYGEDVKPFGFRVVHAIPNGFSFTVERRGESDAQVQYALHIVDPSVSTLGPAEYRWQMNAEIPVSGQTVEVKVEKDEPFTLVISRTRDGSTESLSFDERGNDLDRNGGQAFVRNLVQP